MVNDYEFNKKFGNMGIDRESVRNASKTDTLSNVKRQQEEMMAAEAKNSDQQVQQPKPLQVTGQPSSNALSALEHDMMILNRKLDYLQTSVLKKFEEKIAEIDQKVEANKSGKMEYNRDMTELRNEISDLRKKLSSVRISFGDGAVSSAPAAPESRPVQAQGQPSSAPIPPTSESSGRGGGNPGNIRVEDYFNFSNKKFN